jgi:hypothetical protein
MSRRLQDRKSKRRATLRRSTLAFCVMVCRKNIFCAASSAIAMAAIPMYRASASATRSNNAANQSDRIPEYQIRIGKDDSRNSQYSGEIFSPQMQYITSNSNMNSDQILREQLYRADELSRSSNHGRGFPIKGAGYAHRTTRWRRTRRFCSSQTRVPVHDKMPGTIARLQSDFACRVSRRLQCGASF